MGRSLDASVAWHPTRGASRAKGQAEEAGKAFRKAVDNQVFELTL